jgi:hypothetical protein
MTNDQWLRRAIVRAFERIPVVDRPWNEKVADAIMSDERFREDLGPVTELYDALDDLWGHIAISEVDLLSSDSIRTAQRVHELIWRHPDA